MVDKNNIEALLKEALSEINEQLEENKQILFVKETRFIGSNACMDSMTLVSFILLLEELIENTFDVKVQLVSDKAFSTKNSPFYSLETLTLYLQELIQNG